MAAINPNLPHYEVRVFLSERVTGRQFDVKFAELVGLPVGPAYSSNLNIVISALCKTGWWWHLSHLEAVVIPTRPVKGAEDMIDNAAIYDRSGRTVGFRVTAHQPGSKAIALCKAWVRAVYNLPAAFFVEESESERYR